MTAYRPTAYIAICEARLAALDAMARPLSPDELRERQSLKVRISYSRRQRLKYASDANYRAARCAAARDWNRAAYGWSARL